MKLLIAGATGLIGKELVRQCRESGIEINYLTTRKEKIKQEDGIQGFYWNPSEGEIDTSAFEGVNAIINLAGATVSKRWTSAYKKQILDSRIQTAELLHSSLKSMSHEVTHYVSSSGISVYPSSMTKLYSEEEKEISDTFLGKVVEEWETAADAFKSLGIKVAKIRTGIVLDENDGALANLVSPIKMGMGAPLGNGEQWQSWIHVEDIAGIYLFIIKNQLEGVYNGVAPNPVTNKRMTRVIASELEKPLWMPKVPGFGLKLMLGEMSEIVLESQLVSAEKIETAGYKFHFVNIEKAIEDLL